MVRDGLNLGDELDDLGGLVVGVAVVLVVLFPLEDEKNVDVNQLFSGHVCLLENMNLRVLANPPGRDGSETPLTRTFSSRTMVGGAAEPRLQAVHRDRCTG